MNAGKRSRHISSIISRNQEGGSKKAGIPPVMALTSANRIAYKNRGLPKSVTQMETAQYSNVHQSRNIGRNYNRAYWSFI